MVVIRVLLCALSLFGWTAHALADVSEATHILSSTEQFDRVAPLAVKVYVTKPAVQFKVVGTVEARGMAQAKPTQSLNEAFERVLRPPVPLGEREDLELALQALKLEAAGMGANGVVIERSEQVRVSSSATERRISALAIRTAGPVEVEPSAASSDSGVCTTSRECMEGHFCRRGACEYVPPWGRKAGLTAKGSALGDACYEDAHCKTGVCGKYNRCEP